MARTTVPDPITLEVQVSGNTDADEATESSPTADGAIPGSGGESGVQGGDPARVKKDSVARKAAAVEAGKAALRSMQAVGTSVVGANARDSGLMRKIGAGTSMVGYTVGIIANPVIGSIALASNLIQSSIQYELNRRREREELTIANERAGYRNRSR